MRQFFCTALALTLLPGAFAQERGAPPGFPIVNNSNILHPGLPPQGAARVPQRLPPRQNGGVGRRYYGGGALLIPYPGYVDPFYAGETGYDPAFGGYPQPVPPTIIINQNFQPETIHPQFRDYSNVPLPEPGVVISAPAGPPAPTEVTDQQQNVYLIAMKDNSVVTAQAYWVQDDTLNYVTLKGVQNHISLSLVDRELSARLNGERQVQFRIPAVR